MFPSRPQTKEELFNLHHASTFNVIEWIIEVLKWQFRILHQTPSYNMDVQTLIPPAACAIHNFIHCYDTNELETLDYVSEDWQPGEHTEIGEAEDDLAMNHPNCAIMK